MHPGLGEPKGKLARVRAWAWPAIAVVLAATLLFVAVDPLRPLPEIEADEIAAAWSRSVSRLGILPVFPPEEDLHVGDVWALILDEPGDTTPILAKAVRIGHIDLRADLASARNRQPVFADSAPFDTALGFRRQDRNELAALQDDTVVLTLIAFPGITIRHGRRTGGSIAQGFGAFGVRRDDVQSEEIRIPFAETWGVPAAAAIGRLDAWCKALETALNCDDRFVRRLLAFTLGNEVQARRADGTYEKRLQLQLVTRVFLMREIEHQRLRTVAGAAGAQIGTAPAASALAGSNTPAGAEAPVRAGLNEVEGALRTTPATSAPFGAGGIQQAQLQGADFVLRQVFQRPVVFGFRAISIALPPSTSTSEPNR